MGLVTGRPVASHEVLVALPSDPFDLLERFLRVPSPSGGEGPYAALVAEVLRDIGWRVDLLEVAPGRPNLLARPPGVDRPRAWLSTHLDVVPPELPVRREPTRMWGRGAADTKGPLVAMLHAGVRLREEGRPPGFLFVVGEEVDHSGALHAAHACDLGGARLILGEPTSNRLVAAQKGMLKLRVQAEGRAGHSAFPERGVSAIHRLLALFAAVEREPWASDPVLGPTTWNVGLIEGGVAANVFAPAAEAQVLFRLAGAAAPLEERLRALCPEGVRFERISGNDPVWFTPPEGFPTCVVPFNTDAAYLAPLGCPVWLVGPGAIELAHSVEEHIDRSDLLQGIETYARLCRLAGD